MLAQMRALLDGGTPAPVTQGPRSLPKTRPIDKLLVKGVHRVRLLPVEQISWIEADGVYVKLHTRDGAEHLHRGLLGSLDEMLDERRFVRIHRSAIVNVERIAELQPLFSGEYSILLQDGTKLTLSRNYKDKLFELLGKPL